MNQDRLDIDDSPEGIKEITANAVRKTYKKKNEVAEAAKYFGVTEDKVDNQMLDMMRSMQESGV